MEHRPVTPDELMELLENLGISTQTRQHPALFTVEDGVEIKKSIPGGHTKNLFVKDKKGNYFLIIAGDQARIPMNRIHSLVGARSRLSFANADALMQYLGISPGSVTAFAAINDRAGLVKVIIDEPLLDSDLINCHPLTNTMTTTISRPDLLRFLEHVDHKPEIIALSTLDNMANKAGENT